MNSDASDSLRNTREPLSLKAAYSCLRRNIRVVAKSVALIIVIFELGAIWNEVHLMRNEQVKNVLYSLPKERRNALRGTPATKHMESTSFVEGNVSIDGAVELDQPVEVEIDR